MPIELSTWSIHTYTHRAMIIITLTVGNDGVKSKPQVENIISNSLCTGRLDFFEKLEMLIQVMDSQPAHKPPKMQLTKYKTIMMYSHFSNYHDIHTIYIIRATQYVLKSDVLTVYHTAQG